MSAPFLYLNGFKFITLINILHKILCRYRQRFFVGDPAVQAYDGGVWGVVSASLFIVISLSISLSGK